MAESKKFARWPQTYGGQKHDRGQLIELCGLPNDEALDRLGYVADVPRDTTLKECGVCGAKFIDESSRNGHAERRHREHYLTPEEEDQEIEREEALLHKTAPLNLDKTAATRGVPVPGRRKAGA